MSVRPAIAQQALADAPSAKRATVATDAIHADRTTLFVRARSIFGALLEPPTEREAALTGPHGRRPLEPRARAPGRVVASTRQEHHRTRSHEHATRDEPDRRDGRFR